MKRINLVFSLFFVTIVVSAIYLLGYLPRQPEEIDGEKFSVETTPIGRLIDTPCSRELFVTKFGAGEMLNKLDFVRHLTMRRLSSFPIAKINELKLRAIQADFSGLDPRSASCKRQQS